MTTPAQPPRVEVVDVVRGLVMVLMALDHSREFLYSAALDPYNLSRTSPALFLTRWIPQFATPAFFFLAGTAAALSLGRRRTPGELARFLAIRGLFLILLELTLVRFAWTFFAAGNSTVSLLVLWALGCSMLVLALFVYFPPTVTAIVGVALIAGHNLLDQILAPAGLLSVIWNILHVRGGWAGDFLGLQFVVGYPLIPWPGVLLLGWAYGAALRPSGWLHGRLRSPRTLAIGIALTLLFIVIRASNAYGDPSPWTQQRTPLYTVFSFLTLQKYPPSLDFLLLRMGPLLILLALWDRPPGWLGRLLRVFGQAALFFYLVHLPLLHFVGAILHAVRFGTEEMWRAPWLRTNPGLGQPLWAVYGVWIIAIVLLFPLCGWWAGLKRRRRGWIRYL